MPHRLFYVAGEVVFLRARIIEPTIDMFKVRIEGQGYALTTWAPVSEIAKAEDIHLLRPLPPGALIEDPRNR